MWKSLKDATDEKPWLWAVVVGAILLPIVLIYIFCFPAKVCVFVFESCLSTYLI